MIRDDEIFFRAMQALAAGDIPLARRLMARAAKADHLEALTLCAFFVEHGVGGRPSASKAMAYHRKAAELGEPGSCLRLGRWHTEQKQIPQAKFWLRKARSHPRVWLALAMLNTGNRSIRATNSIKWTIAHLNNKASELNAKERLELAALEEACHNHNPLIWDVLAGIKAAKQRKIDTAGISASKLPESRQSN